MPEPILKYKELIKSQDLTTDCPFNNCKIAMGIGFHYITDPIQDEINFLPRLIRSKKTGIPVRKNDETDELKCSSCALSMYVSKDKAIKKYFNIPEPQKSKLGYTHLSHGVIDNLGFTSITNNSGHFDLFEFDGVDLRGVFVTVESLES